MRLGEVKCEALKLMFANREEDIDAERLADLTDSPEYGTYLIAMPGSVNRCFADMEIRGVLPEASVRLSASRATEEEGRFCFCLAEQIPDYGYAERLICERDGRIFEVSGLRACLTGGVLSLPPFEDAQETYRLVYRPRLPRVSSHTDDGMELPLPDMLAAWIPYWIKGELFREDEPNEAGEARNWYEAAMERAAFRSSPRQGSIYSVYACEEETG